MNQTAHDELIAIRDLQISIQSEGSFFGVVKDVSLSIRMNEIVCLVGESGCGKSITALSVMGLLPPDVARITGGEILYRGQNLLGLNSRDMRRLRSDEISMIFQDPITSLDPVFTIGSLLRAEVFVRLFVLRIFVSEDGRGQQRRVFRARFTDRQSTHRHPTGHLHY